MTLVVGPERSYARVHKDLLCEAAPYFEKALAPGFKKGEERTIMMPEDDPDIVDAFLKFTYGEERPTGFTSICDCEQVFEEHLDKDYIHQALELYFFADKYGIEGLTELVTECFLCCVCWNYSPPTIEQYNKVFEKTPSNSALRRLFLDWGIRAENLDRLKDAKTREWMQREPEIATEFVVALSAKVKRLVSHFSGRSDMAVNE